MAFQLPDEYRSMQAARLPVDMIPGGFLQYRKNLIKATAAKRAPADYILNLPYKPLILDRELIYPKLRTRHTMAKEDSISTTNFWAVIGFVGAIFAGGFYLVWDTLKETNQSVEGVRTEIKGLITEVSEVQQQQAATNARLDGTNTRLDDILAELRKP